MARITVFLSSSSLSRSFRLCDEVDDVCRKRRKGKKNEEKKRHLCFWPRFFFFMTVMVILFARGEAPPSFHIDPVS